MLSLLYSLSATWNQPLKKTIHHYPPPNQSDISALCAAVWSNASVWWRGEPAASMDSLQISGASVVYKHTAKSSRESCALYILLSLLFSFWELWSEYLNQTSHFMTMHHRGAAGVAAICTMSLWQIHSTSSGWSIQPGLVWWEDQLPGAPEKKPGSFSWCPFTPSPSFKAISPFPATPLGAPGDFDWKFQSPCIHVTFPIKGHTHTYTNTQMTAA